MTKFVLALLGLLGGLTVAVATGPVAPPPQGANPQTPTSVPFWISSPVAPSGYDNALAINPQSAAPHLVFRDPAAGDLRHATHGPEGWSSDVIAQVEADHPDLSFAVAVVPSDPATTPAPLVAFADAETLAAGYFNAGKWQLEPLGDGGRLVSLVAGELGPPHLALVRGEHVVYYRHSGSEWLPEMVGPADPHIWNLWLAIDAAGAPHLAGTGANGSFHAVRNGPDDWTVEPLPLPNIEGYAISPAGEPYFLVTRAEPQGGRPPFSLVHLTLAERDGQGWKETPLWDDYDWGGPQRLAGAPDGSLHIVFQDVAGRIHYLRRAAGGGWSVELAGFGDGDISLAIDDSGQPAIALRQNGWLHLATRAALELEPGLFLPAIVR